MVIERKNRNFILKEGLEHFLEEFLNEFFPKIPENLEVNFEPLVEKRDGHLIYEARSLETGETIMLHIKMQPCFEEGLPLKMLDYDFELREKYNAKVVSIVLGYLDYPVSAPGFIEERNPISGELEHYFRFNQVHLKRLNWEDYKGKADNPIVLCFLGLMNDAEKDKDEIRLFFYTNLLRMDMSDEKKKVVLKIFKTYLPFVDEDKEKHFKDKLNEFVKKEGLEEELLRLKMLFSS